MYANLRAEVVVRSIPASVPWLPEAWRHSFLSWTAGGAPVEDNATVALIEQGMQSYRMSQPGPQRITEDELKGLGLPVLSILAGRSPMHDSAAAAQVPGGPCRTGACWSIPTPRTRSTASTRTGWRRTVDDFVGVAD